MSEIATILIEIGSFKISNENFTWASGIKSPCYCDNRLLLSYPKYWDVVIKKFCEVIKNQDIDIIAGVATAGIPHAAAISRELNLPMIYVRSKSKGHGKQNKIEGSFRGNQNVAVIEDLFSTGMSSIDAACSLDEAGLNVSKIYSIFSYELKSLKENMKKSGFEYASLLNIHDILKTYSLGPEQKVLIDQFMSEYVL